MLLEVGGIPFDTTTGISLMPVLSNNSPEEEMFALRVFAQALNPQGIAYVTRLLEWPKGISIVGNLLGYPLSRKLPFGTDVYFPRGIQENAEAMLYVLHRSGFEAWEIYYSYK